MSIERSPVPSSPKPTHGAEASHGKGKSQGTGATAGGDAGGFSALLLTLGAQESDAGEVVAGAGLVPMDAVLPLDASLLLAQSVQLASPLEAKLAETASNPTATVLPASNAVLDKHALRAKTELRAEIKDPASLVPASDSEIDQALEAARKTDAKELTQAQHAGHKPLVADDKNQQLKSKLEAQAHEQKLKLFENAVIQTASTPPQLSQALASGDSGLKQAERLKERLALKSVGASEGGAWGYQALAEAGRIQAPEQASASAALPPELMAAEQVRYWINNNVQNAELKFDGLGEGTVKVNISLQGNEATVQFQSDQPETRQILEGAAAHLKDMLGNEGLVLSSVSVGTSNSGGADPRHSRPAPTARQTTVAVAPVRMTDAAVRAPRPSGRALDLFV